MDLTSGSFIGGGNESGDTFVDFVSASDIEDYIMSIGEDAITDKRRQRALIIAKIEQNLLANTFPKGDIDIILVAKVAKFHDSTAVAIIAKPTAATSGSQSTKKVKESGGTKEEKKTIKNRKNKNGFVGEAQFRSMVVAEELHQKQPQSIYSIVVDSKCEGSSAHVDEGVAPPYNNLPYLPPHAENTEFIDWSHADSQFGLSQLALGVYATRICNVSEEFVPIADERNMMHLIDNDILCTSDRAHLEAYIDILRKTLCCANNVTIHTSHARLQKTHKEIEEFATDAPWTSPCSRAHVDLLQTAWILYRFRTKVLGFPRITITVHPASEVKPSKTKKPSASVMLRDAMRHEMSILALKLEDFALEQKSILISKIQKGDHSDHSTLIAKPWPIVNSEIC